MRIVLSVMVSRLTLFTKKVRIKELLQVTAHTCPNSILIKHTFSVESFPLPIKLLGSKSQDLNIVRRMKKSLRNLHI